MNKSRFRSLVLPLLAVPLGGLVFMGMIWILYVVVYRLLESLFYPGDALGFSAGIARQGYALVLVLLYLLLLRTRLPDLLKAILLTGPLAAVMIAVGFTLYQTPVLSIGVMVVVAAVCLLLLYRFKKPWVYYYAAGFASLVAIAYAWPAR